MTNEDKVKAKVKAILDRLKPECWYFMPIPMWHRGVPDFVGVYRGKFFTIETKSGKNIPTALQKLCMAEIVGASGQCIVINEKNITELEHWMETL